MSNHDVMTRLSRELSHEAERQNQEDELESFVPRRMRADRQVAARPESLAAEPVEPADLLARNAAAVYDGVREVQEKERRAREALNVAEAKLEQSQAYNRQLQSDLHSAKTELDRERAERVRLATIIENVGGLVQDGLANRAVDPA